MSSSVQKGKRLADSYGENDSVSKKSRNANWSLDQVKALVDAMSIYYQDLFGSHSNVITEKRKAALWAIICDQVNSSDIIQRDLKFVKKKWSELKSQTKKKAAVILREKGVTGGGEAEDVPMERIEEHLADMEFWEVKVARLIGPVGILGITGGIDTSRHCQAPSTELDAEDAFPGIANVVTESGSFSMSEEEIHGCVTAIPNSENGEAAESTGPPLPRARTSDGKFSTFIRNTKSAKDALPIGTAMVDIQKELMEQVRGINSSLKELVILQKIRQGIDPNQFLGLPLEIQVVNQPPIGH